MKERSEEQKKGRRKKKRRKKEKGSPIVPSYMCPKRTPSVSEETKKMRTITNSTVIKIAHFLG